MPAQPAPSSNEKAFLIFALRHNIRLDNRPLTAYRPVSLDFPSSDYGTTDVRIGKTASSPAYLPKSSSPTQTGSSRESSRSKPRLDHWHEDGMRWAGTLLESETQGGHALYTYALSEAANLGGVTRPDTQDLILSRLLEKTIRRSNALDTEILCLIAG